MIRTTASLRDELMLLEREFGVVEVMVLGDRGEVLNRLAPPVMCWDSRERQALALLRTEGRADFVQGERIYVV